MTDPEKWAELKRKSFDLLAGETVPDGSGYWDEQAADIMAQALTNLEPDEVSDYVVSLDPGRPDPLAEWAAMRPKPQPPPRPRGRDTVPSAAEQQRWNAAFDRRFDHRLQLHLDQTTTSFLKAQRWRSGWRDGR
jgi:hypothetical protein